MNKSHPRLFLHVFVALAGLTEAAAAYVADLSARAVEARGRFTVAFSGGSLPGLLCPGLVAEPLCTRVDWAAWHVFFADERCVPLADPQSNYRRVREELLDRVPIVPGQVYALDDARKAEVAAAAYQARMAQVLAPPAGELPRFDLILLGLGEDGHTASLFPSHPLLRETVRWVAPVFDSPKPPPQRITLTLPVLNNARDVVFIAAGAGKADTLARVLGSDATQDALPARLVQPRAGHVTWFVDEAAASTLAGGVHDAAGG